MSRHEGSCHCGAINVCFETAADLVTRECLCSYCQRQGARYTSDANGHIDLSFTEDGVLRYRFGTAQADFLSCRTCGVYVGAVAALGEDHLMVLNINSLENHDQFPEPQPHDYDGEAADARAGRWQERWTPVTLKIN